MPFLCAQVPAAKCENWLKAISVDAIVVVVVVVIVVVVVVVVVIVVVLETMQSTTSPRVGTNASHWSVVKEATTSSFVGHLAPR
jgi:heme/copper-type cytochrome/quinol oxidase subunit 2